MLKFPTIVTSFYNIRKTENNEANTRTILKYLELASKFILKLPYPLIIFVDNNDNDIIDFINEHRKNYKNITFLRKINIEDTHYYKHIDRLTQLQNEYTIYNLDKNKDTPLYITLTNNKFYFLKSAIKMNPFESSHFIWMDFGINHCAQNCEKFHEWVVKVPDKIKQLCINPFIEQCNYKHFFQNIYHHLASGVFSGSSENMLKYCNLFENKIDEIYNEGWYQLEEAVMTILHRDYPEMFDLYFGDYNSIISNYLEPVNNINLIIENILPKVIINDKVHLASNILQYMYNYFKNNKNSPHVYRFIEQNIAVNFFANNKLLLPEIIYFINEKLLNDDEIVKMILKNNSKNINFYENKHLILPYE
jgi:hypothetical protein